MTTLRVTFSHSGMGISFLFMMLIFNWLYDLLEVSLQCKDTNFLEYAIFFAFFHSQAASGVAGRGLPRTASSDVMEAE